MRKPLSIGARHKAALVSGVVDTLVLGMVRLVHDMSGSATTAGKQRCRKCSIHILLVAPVDVTPSGLGQGNGTAILCIRRLTAEPALNLGRESSRPCMI